MIKLGSRSYLLFDGDCGVCASSAEFARRIDKGGRFEIIPYQTVPENELKRFGIDYVQCNRRIQAISPSGRVYSGAFALNNFLSKRFPWVLLVGLIYAIPVLLLFEIIIYALVAKHRHRISRWLGLKACLIRSASGDSS